MSISRKNHRDIGKIFQSSRNEWLFLICATFILNLCHELTLSEMFGNYVFSLKRNWVKTNTNAESCWKHSELLRYLAHYIWLRCLFATKYQKSRIVMLQVFSFRDTSNPWQYCDLRNISRVGCALNVNNFKTAAVMQLSQLKFPSLMLNHFNLYLASWDLKFGDLQTPGTKMGPRSSYMQTSMTREQGAECTISFLSL